MAKPLARRPKPRTAIVTGSPVPQSTGTRAVRPSARQGQRREAHGPLTWDTPTATPVERADGTRVWRVEVAPHRPDAGNAPGRGARRATRRNRDTEHVHEATGPGWSRSDRRAWAASVREAREQTRATRRRVRVQG